MGNSSFGSGCLKSPIGLWLFRVCPLQAALRTAETEWSRCHCQPSVELRSRDPGAARRTVPPLCDSARFRQARLRNPDLFIVPLFIVRFIRATLAVKPCVRCVRGKEAREFAPIPL